MPNRLADETSPYLLQHQDNPVDWYPWVPEALEKSRQENIPIFLSIGYSACHWCHVMEHESFESESIAEQLRDRFVCIKVDREERPDLDQIYMNAVQMMTGQGGWPMSVFLTPDLKPFFAGTYFPPAPRMNMPSFSQIIEAVHTAWDDRRQVVLEHSEEITRRISLIGSEENDLGEMTFELLAQSATSLEDSFDFTNGGFGRAPKFPHAMDLQLLLRSWQRNKNERHLRMVTLNLDKMARGGIYDHLGGGFSRYSVDAFWLVPHFEKMLYDNSLLAGVYIDAYAATSNSFYATVAGEIFDYTLAYLTDEQGGFHSTEDADSEGVEGKFYVWLPNEIEEIIGTEAAEKFCSIYDITASGNFEGNNIPNLKAPIEELIERAGWDVPSTMRQLGESRRKLLAARDTRVRPAKDDKILASWNALMIDAMARAAAILNEPKYLDAAIAATDFVLSNMRRPDGRLLHSWREGRAKFDAYLDDYSYFINAFVSLYEATFDDKWLELAVEFAETILVHFEDREKGGFYYTADDHEQLITRNKDVHDSSVPSGSSMTATSLLRLGKLTGNQRLVDAAATTINNALPIIQRQPAAAGQMLVAADFLLGPTKEIVVAGDSENTETQNVLRALQQKFIPRTVLAFLDTRKQPYSRHLDALLKGKEAVDGNVTLFICEDFSCQAPISGEDEILAAIKSL
jgi:uncharacterized protein YyaL (SSP411 family)